MHDERAGRLGTWHSGCLQAARRCVTSSSSRRMDSVPLHMLRGGMCTALRFFAPPTMVKSYADVPTSGPSASTATLTAHSGKLWTCVQAEGLQRSRTLEQTKSDVTGSEEERRGEDRGRHGKPREERETRRWWERVQGMAGGGRRTVYVSLVKVDHQHGGWIDLHVHLQRKNSNGGVRRKYVRH